MRVVELDLPEIGLIAATRGMLGAGIGLLLAGDEGVVKGTGVDHAHAA